jgi:hypothetical protein
VALGDFDDELDEQPHREPLPPDDRLWRHPSELDQAAATGAPKRGTRVSRLLSNLFPRR